MSARASQRKGAATSSAATKLVAALRYVSETERASNSDAPSSASVSALSPQTASTASYSSARAGESGAKDERWVMVSSVA